MDAPDAPRSPLRRRRRLRGRVRAARSLAALAGLAAIALPDRPDASSSRLGLLRVGVARRLGDLGDATPPSSAASRGPYALTSQLGSLPEVPPARPSHVRLCREYLSRLDAAASSSSSGSDPEPGWDSELTVIEDPAVCGDWRSPHQSVLRMYASALVARAGEGLGLRYSHSCGRTAPSADDGRDYDFTCLQQLLPPDLIDAEEEAAAASLDGDAVAGSCRACLEEFDASPPRPGFVDADAGADQCLLMPESNIGAAGEGPLSPLLAAVLPSLRRTLNVAASLYLNRTDSAYMPLEHLGRTDAVIYLDGTSTYMDPRVYDRHVPPDVTHVQIFASAGCAAEQRVGRSRCIEHGGNLRRYLNETRGGTGTYVRYDVVASTAASFARMVRARHLVCPPGSVPCLLPALVRGRTSTVLAESAANPVGRGWFDRMGDPEVVRNVLVVKLTEEETGAEGVGG